MVRPLAWIYSDETTEALRQLFDSVADTGALVPALWRLEVANSLTVAIRRGRIDAEFRRAALDDLALLDITTDARADSHSWAETCCSLTVSGSQCTMPPILSWRGGVRCRLLHSTKSSAPPHPPLASKFSGVARERTSLREYRTRCSRRHILGRRQTTLGMGESAFPDISLSRFNGRRSHSLSSDSNLSVPRFAQFAHFGRAGPWRSSSRPSAVLASFSKSPPSSMTGSKYAAFGCLLDKGKR
jgi:hypothetical protein